MYETILFLDFDGTITTEETLEGAMRLCVDPFLYREKERDMLEGRATLKETIRLAFANIASRRLPEIMAYVKGVPLRAGFSELLDAMQAQSIPVVVISGGLQPYVEERLAPYRDRLLAIHSVGLDCSGPTMRLTSDYENADELMDKTRVMALYEYRCAVCVGDGLTDVRMAHAANRVFARDTLAEVLQKKGAPFTPWNDFFDVLGGMREA